jgi:hypothetical protein
MVENDGAWENTPLLSSTSRRTAAPAPAPAPAPTLISRPTFRESVHQFLEAQTPLGKWYEKLTIGLILVNMVAFVLASLFVTEYNAAPWADPETGICGMVCDALWFGNYASNPLSSMSLNSKGLHLHLHLGTTSVLEVLTVLVFSGDYLLRVWTADLEHPRFKGLVGRLRYLPTFYAPSWPRPSSSASPPGPPSAVSTTSSSAAPPTSSTVAERRTTAGTLKTLTPASVSLTHGVSWTAPLLAAPPLTLSQSPATISTAPFPWPATTPCSTSLANSPSSTSTAHQA